MNDLDDSLEGIGRFLQRNPETCFVAVEGESIAGCILAGTDGRRAYIYHTAVHPEFRRRGIGRQLVERLLAALQKIGFGLLWEISRCPSRFSAFFNRNITYPFPTCDRRAHVPSLQ